MSELTAKQAAFVREYLIDSNGTQAAIRAGYSPKTAQEQASRLLSNVMVANAVKSGQDARAQDAGGTVEKVLKEIAHYAFLDPGEAFGEDGALLPIREMPEHVRRAVQSIEVLEEFEGSGQDRKFIGYTKKLKFVPKDKGTDQLGRYLKMFVDRVEQKTAADDPILAILNDIAGRAKLKPNAASAKP